MAHPAYYAHMAPLNRAGVPVLGGPPDAPVLGARALAHAQDRGAWIIDARDRDAFAAGHIPGSLNIELNSGFGGYAGWMLPFGAPLVLVLPDQAAEEAARDAATQLLRIGWTPPHGRLGGGIDGWNSELWSYPTAGIGDLREAVDPLVLDVRQELEWDWGVIPGSRTIFVADLPGRLSELPRDREIWVVCSNGHRASIAASLLDRAGIPVRLIGRDGVGQWRRRRAGTSAVQ